MKWLTCFFDFVSATGRFMLGAWALYGMYCAFGRRYVVEDMGFNGLPVEDRQTLQFLWNYTFSLWMCGAVVYVVYKTPDRPEK